MTEDSLLKAVRKKLGRHSLLGDDCAVIPPARPDHEMLVTTDLFLEDVHFRREALKAAEVGRRVLARGLSDIAAMGGRPLYCLLSLALPEWADRRWVMSFYDGLLKLADSTGTRLAGGDLSHAKHFAADIVAIGEAPRRAALRRDGARPGDSLYVSGVLGGAALALAAGQTHAIHPRLELGAYLRGKATACMDLSDGLSLDLHRLCTESRVAAVVDHPLPVFPGADLDQALHGGEDYELLFTAPPTLKIPEFRRGLPLTRIGSIVRGKPGSIRFFGRPLKPLGYDHFRKP